MAFEDLSPADDAERLANIGRELCAAICALERVTEPNVSSALRTMAYDELAALITELHAPPQSTSSDAQLRIRFDRLHELLSMSVQRAADRCADIADGLAVLEETSLESPCRTSGVTARSVAELGRRFSRLPAS